MTSPEMLGLALEAAAVYLAWKGQRGTRRRRDESLPLRNPRIVRTYTPRRARR